MISLIISVYKRIDFLELILQALERQAYCLNGIKSTLIIPLAQK